nr:MAG TPA: hypothetical protein [Caudoviricetes sp.]
MVFTPFFNCLFIWCCFCSVLSVFTRYKKNNILYRYRLRICSALV